MGNSPNRAANAVLASTVALSLISFGALRLDFIAIEGGVFDVAANHNIDSLSLLAVAIAPWILGVYFFVSQRADYRLGVPPWPLATYGIWCIATLPLTVLPYGLAFGTFVAVVPFVTWFVRRFGLESFMTVLCAPLVVLIAVGLPYEALGLDPRPHSQGWVSRFDGVFTNTSFAGSAGAVLFLTSLSTVARPARNRRARVSARSRTVLAISVVPVALGATSLMWSQSRASLVAAVVAAPAVWLRKRYFSFAVVAGLAVGLAVASGVTDESDFSRLARPDRSEETSLSNRDIVWEGARKVILERPAFGGGASSFTLKFSTEAEIHRPDGRALCPCSAENAWVSIAVEHGLPALAIALVVMFATAHKLVERQGLGPPLFVFLAVGAAVEAFAWSSERALTALVLFAVIASAHTPESSDPPTNPRQPLSVAGR